MTGMFVVDVQSLKRLADELGLVSNEHDLLRLDVKNLSKSRCEAAH